MLYKLCTFRVVSPINYPINYPIAIKCLALSLLSPIHANVEIFDLFEKVLQLTSVQVQ